MFKLIHIQPGKPTENAHVESFHGRLREEGLNVSWFQNLFDARRKIAAWRKEYNQERPHSSLGYRTPEEFAGRFAFSGRESRSGDLASGNPAGSLRSALTPVAPGAEAFHQEGEAKRKMRSYDSYLQLRGTWRQVKAARHKSGCRHPEAVRRDWVADYSGHQFCQHKQPFHPPSDWKTSRTSNP